MESKSMDVSETSYEIANSKSYLCNVSLYSYEWKIDNVSVMNSLLKPISSPLFSVSPSKNYDLKLYLSMTGYDRIKIEVRLVKECKMTEEMKYREENCPLSSKIKKYFLGLEFLDNCGKIIESYRFLPYEFLLINTSVVYAWSKECIATRFIHNDSLFIRAKLSMRFYEECAERETSYPYDSTKVLMNDMKEFFNERNYSPDILIKVGDEYVPCHKSILYSQYPFFGEGMKNVDAPVEKRFCSLKFPCMTNSGCEILQISNEDATIVQSVLHFIYTKQIQDSPIVDDFAMYEFAEKYGIRDLGMLLMPCEIKIHSKIVVKRMKYTWYVKDYSSFNESNLSHIQSPKFKTEIGKGVIIWNIDLTCLHSNDVILDLNARVNGTKVDVQALVKLGVCNANGTIYDERKMQAFFPYAPLHNCHSGFIETESRFLSFPDLLYNDTLTVYCDLTVSCGELSSDIEYCYPSEHPIFNVTYWINNLQKLLETENFSDAVLAVEGKEFKVHRAILAARSPVFARMFENDMQEKRSGCVRIKDASSAVMKKALYYIYTCKIEDLTLSDASELYCVADKYSLTDLKSKCSEIIVQNIDAENACEILIMADLYNDENLKAASNNIICCNAAEALLSPGGVELISNHSFLAHQLLDFLSAVFCSFSSQSTTHT